MLVSPDSLVTVIGKLFLPLTSSKTPVPVTDPASEAALIVIFLVVASTTAV